MAVSHLADLNAMAVATLPDWWEKIDHDTKWQEYSFVALAIAYGLIALVAIVQLVRIQQRVPEYGWTTQKVFHLLNAFVCILRCVVFALRRKVGTPERNHFCRDKWLVVMDKCIAACICKSWLSGFLPRILLCQVKKCHSSVAAIKALCIASNSRLYCGHAFHDLSSLRLSQVQSLDPPIMQEVLLDLPGLLFFSTYTLLVLFWAEIYHQARSLSTTALRPMFVAFNGVVYAVQVLLHRHSLQDSLRDF